MPNPVRGHGCDADGVVLRSGWAGDENFRADHGARRADRWIECVERENLVVGNRTLSCGTVAPVAIHEHK